MIAPKTFSKYNDRGGKMKLNRLQKLLLAFIGFSFAFSLLMNVISVTSPLSVINREGYGFFSLLKYTLVDYPIESVKNGLTVFSRMWQLEEENELLRKQIESMAFMQAQNNELKREIISLKSFSGIKETISDYEVVPATVLTRAEESWNNYLTLNVGTSDGIEANYAIITNQGLIGRVQSVSQNTCIVKLITVGDGSNKVSVKIQISESVAANAILESYDYNEKAFVVKLLDSTSTVTEGMQVVTSGMGGVFPSGLLVGKVIKIEQLTNAIGMNIYVSPSADFQDLDYVGVVKRAGISE